MRRLKRDATNGIADKVFANIIIGLRVSHEANNYVYDHTEFYNGFYVAISAIINDRVISDPTQ